MLVVDMERSESIRGKFCTGADVRLLANDGMDVDRRLAETDGTGTGVAFGDLLLILLVRTVVLPLASDAFDNARAFVAPVDKPTFTDRDVDLDNRVDDSEGVFGAF